jgi:uncharacterized protein
MRTALVLAALAISTVPAAALDCAKATNRTEKLICGHADLRQADEAMSRAYFKLLKQAPEKDSRDALEMSQKRWVDAREKQFASPPDNDTDTPALDEHDLMRKITAARTDALSNASAFDSKTPALLAALAQQKKDADGYKGGPFAGFDTDCSFLPPGWGDGDYLCITTQTYQNKDRVCTVATEWASGHTTDVRTVSNVVNGSLKPVASCASGYSDVDGPKCPDADDADAAAHWDRSPDPSKIKTTAPSPSLPKLDPEADSFSPQDTTWLKACLTDPSYPPASKP